MADAIAGLLEGILDQVEQAKAQYDQLCDCLDQLPQRIESVRLLIEDRSKLESISESGIQEQLMTELYVLQELLDEVLLIAVSRCGPCSLGAKALKGDGAASFNKRINDRVLILDKLLQIADHQVSVAQLAALEDLAGGVPAKIIVHPGARRFWRENFGTDRSIRSAAFMDSFDTCYSADIQRTFNDIYTDLRRGLQGQLDPTQDTVIEASEFAQFVDNSGAGLSKNLDFFDIVTRSACSGSLASTTIAAHTTRIRAVAIHDNFIATGDFHGFIKVWMFVEGSVYIQTNAAVGAVNDTVTFLKFVFDPSSSLQLYAASKNVLVLSAFTGEIESVIREPHISQVTGIDVEGDFCFTFAKYPSRAAHVFRRMRGAAQLSAAAGVGGGGAGSGGGAAAGGEALASGGAVGNGGSHWIKFGNIGGGGSVDVLTCIGDGAHVILLSGGRITLWNYRRLERVKRIDVGDFAISSICVHHHGAKHSLLCAVEKRNRVIVVENVLDPLPKLSFKALKWKNEDYPRSHFTAETQIATGFGGNTNKVKVFRHEIMSSAPLDTATFATEEKMPSTSDCFQVNGASVTRLCTGAKIAVALLDISDPRVGARGGFMVLDMTVPEPSKQVPSIVATMGAWAMHAQPESSSRMATPWCLARHHVLPLNEAGALMSSCKSSTVHVFGPGNSLLCRRSMALEFTRDMGESRLIPTKLPEPLDRSPQPLCSLAKVSALCGMRDARGKNVAVFIGFSDGMLIKQGLPHQEVHVTQEGHLAREVKLSKATGQPKPELAIEPKYFATNVLSTWVDECNALALEDELRAFAMSVVVTVRTGDALGGRTVVRHIEQLFQVMQRNARSMLPGWRKFIVRHRDSHLDEALRTEIHVLLEEAFDIYLGNDAVRKLKEEEEEKRRHAAEAVENSSGAERESEACDDELQESDGRASPQHEECDEHDNAGESDGEGGEDDTASRAPAKTATVRSRIDAFLDKLNHFSGQRRAVEDKAKEKERKREQGRAWREVLLPTCDKIFEVRYVGKMPFMNFGDADPRNFQYVNPENWRVPEAVTRISSGIHVCRNCGVSELDPVEHVWQVCKMCADKRPRKGQCLRCEQQLPTEAPRKLFVKSGDKEPEEVTLKPSLKALCNTCYDKRKHELQQMVLCLAACKQTVIAGVVNTKHTSFAHGLGDIVQLSADDLSVKQRIKGVYAQGYRNIISTDELGGLFAVSMHPSTIGIVDCEPNQKLCDGFIAQLGFPLPQGEGLRPHDMRVLCFAAAKQSMSPSSPTVLLFADMNRSTVAWHTITKGPTPWQKCQVAPFDSRCCVDVQGRVITSIAYSSALDMPLLTIGCEDGVVCLFTGIEEKESVMKVAVQAHRCEIISEIFFTSSSILTACNDGTFGRIPIDLVKTTRAQATKQKDTRLFLLRESTASKFEVFGQTEKWELFDGEWFFSDNNNGGLKRVLDTKSGALTPEMMVQLDLSCAPHGSRRGSVATPTPAGDAGGDGETARTVKLRKMATTADLVLQRRAPDSKGDAGGITRLLQLRTTDGTSDEGTFTPLLFVSRAFAGGFTNNSAAGKTDRGAWQQVHDHPQPARLHPGGWVAFHFCLPSGSAAADSTTHIIKLAPLTVRGRCHLLVRRAGQSEAEARATAVCISGLEPLWFAFHNAAAPDDKGMLRYEMAVLPAHGEDPFAVEVFFSSLVEHRDETDERLRLTLFVSPPPDNHMQAAAERAARKQEEKLEREKKKETEEEGGVAGCRSPSFASPDAVAESQPAFHASATEDEGSPALATTAVEAAGSSACGARAAESLVVPRTGTPGDDMEQSATSDLQDHPHCVPVT